MRSDLSVRRPAEAGVSMVAMIAALTIMMIMMAVAVPSWRYVMKDAREEELLFRGVQIAEAIERYQKKNGNALPPSLEVLVQQKHLRKLYKDPFAKDGKWRLLRPGEVLLPPGINAGPSPPASTLIAGPAGSGPVGGAIQGVASYNRDKSLRIFNGRTRYSEWFFMAGQPRIIGRQVGPTLGGPVASPSPGASPGASPGTTRPGGTDQHD